MLRSLKKVPLRIVVTGSRGKSSLTRLLHAGLAGCGLSVYARITGVIPRELSPRGERTIRRTSPASVQEMRWWLSEIPPEANAVILENSAISPSLQFFASDLLSPGLVVWTTLRADHVETWGPGREGAARTLIEGIPRGVPIAAGTELTRSPLPFLLEANGNALYVPDIPDTVGHAEANQALALLACTLCGVDAARADRAMSNLLPDMADFRVLRDGSDELAVAFSANDVDSTGRLFSETGWRPEETTLLYHHRSDRNARLENFLTWIEKYPWKETVFTRQSLPFLRKLTTFFSYDSPRWNDAIDSPLSFAAWRRGRGRVFACGNVAGWPLEFLRVSWNC